MSGRLVRRGMLKQSRRLEYLKLCAGWMSTARQGKDSEMVSGGKDGQFVLVHKPSPHQMHGIGDIPRGQELTGFLVVQACVERAGKIGARLE